MRTHAAKSPDKASTQNGVRSSQSPSPLARIQRAAGNQAMQKAMSSGAPRRRMRLTHPELPAPMPEDFIGPAPTRAAALQRWLDDLCRPGAFVVNPSTGIVTPARESVCREPQTLGCECLCEATTGSSKDIEIQVDKELVFLGKPNADGIAIEEEHDLAAAGGGKTYSTKSSAIVGMRGGVDLDLAGVGDTSPKQPDTGSRDQVLRTPEWLLFGHELGGHGLAEEPGHVMTPEGNRTANDVENQLRRERSTMEDNLGIRHGTASFGAGDWAFDVEGALFRVKAGDKLRDIADRLGIPEESILDRIRKGAVHDGETITSGGEVWIEGIAWHTVIKSETVTSIAAMWNITPEALQHANPQIPLPKGNLPPGIRLLIPAS